MPQTALSNIGINYNWNLGDDGWRAGMDNNLALLDVLPQAGITVDPKSVSAQPGSPANGAVYILGSSPSGAAWGARSENDIAVYSSATGWHFSTPREGWTVYDRVNDRWLYYDGTNWVGRGGAPISVTTTGTTTPTILQANHLFLLDAATKNFQIPNNASVAFPIGTKLTAINLNSNTANIQDGGSVTWLSQDPTGVSPALQQNDILEVQKIDTDQWVVLRNEALP